jgi:aconitate hydratase
MVTSPELVYAVYKKSQQKILEFRKIVSRPLTLTEKIIAGHLIEVDKKDNIPEPGKSYVLLQPDRVALQDVTGQMTILQFMVYICSEHVVNKCKKGRCKNRVH